MKCGNRGYEIKYGDRMCPGCGLPLPMSNYKDFKPEETSEKDEKPDVEADVSANKEDQKKSSDFGDKKDQKKSSDSGDKKDQKKSSKDSGDEVDYSFDESLFDLDDDIVDIEPENDKKASDSDKKKKDKKNQLVYSDDKLPEEDDVIDAEFVDIDEADSFKAPSTKVKTKHVLTTGDKITIAVGIALLIALIIGGIIWLVNKSHKKMVEDNRFGKEEVEGFFNGISELDEMISYDYVNGNNCDEIYAIVDERVKLASAFKNFSVDNIEIVEKKEVHDDVLDSMINKTGLDLDRVFILNVTFRYNADGNVLPGKAIIRTGRTKKNKKWWVVSCKMEDVLTAAQEFMDAYSRIDADAIVDSFATGVYSEKDKDAIRKSYKYIIAPFNFQNVKFNAYGITEGRYNEIAANFNEPDKKYSSVIGFKVETYGKNSVDGENRVDFDLVMALDGNKWKVLTIDYIEE